jgi:hypothetical protein
MNALLQQHLARSRLRMKRHADKNRTERQFSVGDSVFLKLQPYVQTSLAPRANQKLVFKYFGPFKIVAKIGTAAYKLQLPSSSAIHPVFHVSQLKQAVTDQTEVVSTMPSDIDCPRVPERVLQRRLVTKGVHPVQQVLVKWSNWPLELSTWEDAIALQQMYPMAPAWGQAATQEGGMSAMQLSRKRKPNPRVFGPEWSV